MPGYRILQTGIAAVISLSASVTYAASDSEKEAARLFGIGVEKLSAKNYDEACPVLAESHRLDPKAGVLFTLAYCEIEAGKLLSSRKNFEEFLRIYNSMSAGLRGKFHDRAKVAKEKLDLIAKEIPTLALTLLPNSPQGGHVFLDEKEIEHEKIGQPIEMDPGKHSVRAEAPGRKTSTETLALARGDVKSHAVKYGPALPPEPMKVPPSNVRRTVAIAVGGVGVVGFLVGGVTGGMAMSRAKVANKECPNGLCMSAEIAEVANNGVMLGNLATVGFGVGLAGVGASAALWFMAPKKPDATSAKISMSMDVINVGIDGAVFGLRGSF